MPDIVRRGVTITEAAQEAAAIAPLGRALLATYEIWHPTMPSGPIRFVNDTATFFGTIEPTAERDAGETVEFPPLPIKTERPEESDSAANPKIRLSRPDIAGILRDGLELARGSLQPWVLIERIYASDRPETPVFTPPRELRIDAASLAQEGASLSASFNDFANEGIPRLTFRREEYLGLDR